MIKELRELVRSIINERLRDDRDMECRKCGTTVPAYDVGHAYYYTCPKCGNHWELTEQKISDSFGEPLLFENIEQNKTTLATITPTKNVGIIRLKISDWTDDMFDELKVHFDAEISDDFDQIADTMTKFNTEWVFDHMINSEEPERFSKWLKLNEPF